MIQDGSTVSLEYTLKLDDGTTADTNVGGEPLVYEQGDDQILPGLERELAGMAVNDTKKVTVSAGEGYGVVDPEAFQEVEAKLIPEEARKPGTPVVADDGDGSEQMVRVHEVKGDIVVLDLNHPLAGETLHFEVKILGID